LTPLSQAGSLRSGAPFASSGHGSEGEQKCGEGKNPGASGDMHERQGLVGKERHGDAGDKRESDAKIGEEVLS